MTTVASKVPFCELSGILERLSKKSGTDEKKKLIKEFIDHWRVVHTKAHKNDPTTTDSFFPAMRLLLPHLERERDAYGIKEHTLAKQYIEILGLGKDSPSAQKLLNYRAPKNVKQDVGDFASVAYWILKPRCPEKGTLSIEEVNDCLDGVARANSLKEKATQKKHLCRMLQNMSALEQKWLVRMIMKELKVGLSQQSIFSIFHQDAEDLFNVKMSLEKVCTTLMDPAVRLHEVEVSLFSPFRPMLGDRGKLNKMEAVMEGKPYIIETKFDGERMQLHKNEDEYKYFSRGGNDYTHVYGSNSFDGNFTPRIANCWKSGVESVILDGEMVGFDPVTKTRASKGENFDIKSLNLNSLQPMFCVFDILMLNGTTLTNKPLLERKEALKTVFEEAEGSILISAWSRGVNNQDCVDALNEAIEAREEGIMVKVLNSVYKPNARKAGWYKIKPEYVSGLMDELDVLVVGGYFGVGHRSGLMSHFLCAVAVASEEGKPKQFHSFCKVGSGYTKKELYEFNRKMQDHWIVFNKKKPPTWLDLAPGLKQRPDAIIEPSNSYILQIKAAEIIESDQYKTECTLRFPRVEKIRFDKPWFDCMTVDELTDLKQKAGGKLFGAFAENEDDEEEPKKKRRKVASRHIKPTVGQKFRGVDVSTVEKVSEMFTGKEICVLSGPSSHPKHLLEKKIVEYGGTIVQNPGEDTYCILTDKINIKVKNIIAKGIYDVVKADWFIRCIKENSVIKWIPSDMLHTSQKMTTVFAQSFDQYGDSYYEDTDIHCLKLVFDKIEKSGKVQQISATDIAEAEVNYFPQECLYGLFRQCRVYMDSNIIPGDESTRIKNSCLELAALEIRLHGATFTSLHDEVSHVVLDSRDTSRLKHFRDSNRKRSKKFHIVTEKWVYDCIEKEKTLRERDYEPA